MKTVQNRNRKNRKTMKRKVGGVIEGSSKKLTFYRAEVEKVSAKKNPVQSVKKTIKSSICPGLIEPETPPNIQQIIDSYGRDIKSIITTGEKVVIDSNYKMKPVSVFQEDDHGSFLYFFKQLIMQPYVRKYFVNKYNPGMYYAMIKFDYQDRINTEKLAFAKQIVESGSDFILDIAQQLDHGGHYTSLKRKNGTIEYMDPDPFFYGDPDDDPFAKAFFAFIKQFPNPSSIYGDNNRAPKRTKKTPYYVPEHALRSIQNVNMMDKFCQSWSLLYITLDSYSDGLNISGNIQFQTGRVLPHDNIEGQRENFPMFVNNFRFLIDFWKTLFNDPCINTILQGNMEGYRLAYKQFSGWSSEAIIGKLEEIKTYISHPDLDFDTCFENIGQRDTTRNTFMVKK